MSRIGDWIQEPASDVRIAAEADVVVVGGGPAGLSAAFAAARNGARVTLLERYNHLGGLASGGMVLVLDDMWDSHLHEISVRGICMEMIERMAALGLAAFPKQDEWGSAPGIGGALGALGHVRLPQQGEAAPDLLRRGLRPGRLEARLAARWSRSTASSCACTLVLAHAGRRQPGQGRDLRHQERPRSDPGQGGDRRHRRPRRRRVGRRAARRRQLHRHHRVPPRRRGHRRGRALRARAARGLRRDRSRGQAGARRQLGLLVAEDAAARRGLVQLPAHAGAGSA